MNNNIIQSRVTYKQGVWIKSLGFDVPIAYYRTKDHVITTHPEQSVVVEWLRVNFQVNVTYTVEVIGSDEWRYGYMICYLPFGFWSEKRRSIHFQTVYSFCEVGSSYTGAWDSPSEAYSAALSYLMSNEIIKQK